MTSRPVRVLLVEDNEMDAALFRHTAETVINGGLRLKEAATAYQAMQLLKEWPLPHAIVIDLQLGDEDGGALVADIRKDPRLMQVPVFTWSYHRDRADYDKADGGVMRLVVAVLRAATEAVPGPLEQLHEAQQAMARDARETREIAELGVSRATNNEGAIRGLEEKMDAVLVELRRPHWLAEVVTRHPKTSAGVFVVAMVLAAFVYLVGDAVTGTVKADVADWLGLEWTAAETLAVNAAQNVAREPEEDERRPVLPDPMPVRLEEQVGPVPVP